MMNLSDKIVTIYNELNSLQSLEPKPHVDLLFTQLVNLVQQKGDIDVLIPDLKTSGISLAEINNLCSRGEIELEYFWADKIANKLASLTDFFYFNNYDELTTFELEKINKHKKLDNSSILYIGSGSLPLTPLMYKEKEQSLTIDCIDGDEKAVNYGKQIFNIHGISSRIFHEQISGQREITSVDVKNYDIAFICALVGNSSEGKNEYLQMIDNSFPKNYLVVLRSVPNDFRRLLYPRFELSASNYRVIAEYSPPKGIINSIVLLGRD